MGFGPSGEAASERRPIEVPDVFADAETIIVPSGSCASMIKLHYEELFANDAKTLERVHDITPRVWEFSEFLLNSANLDALDARFPHKVTYHDSCHALRELGLKQAPRQLLRRVKDLELIEMEAAEECCGFGGTFSVKFAELSSKMAQSKAEAIVNTGAEYVVSIDSSCLMQIEGTLRRAGSPVRAMHLAEVLAAR